MRSTIRSRTAGHVVGASVGLVLLGTAVAVQPGCPQFGCSPRATFATSDLAPFGQPAAAFFVSPPTLVNLTCSSGSHVPGACITTGVASAGSGTAAVCTFTQACNETWATGVVGLTTSGAVNYTYNGPGSGRCTPARVLAQRGVFNTGVTSDTGAFIGADNAAAALLNPDGSIVWVTDVSPASACPDVVTALTLTARPSLVLCQQALGEVATVFTNGVPEGYIRLQVNDTRLVPIGQPSVLAERVVLLTRAYELTQSQLLIPTPDLAIVAVDQTFSPVQRLNWTWTLPMNLSVGAFNAAACKPLPAGTSPGAEVSLRSSNVMIPEPGAVAVLALSCNGTVLVTAFDVTSSHATSLWQWAEGNGTSPAPAVAQLVADPRKNRTDGAWMITETPVSMAYINTTTGDVLWRQDVQPLLRGLENCSNAAASKLALTASVVAGGGRQADTHAILLFAGTWDSGFNVSFAILDQAEHIVVGLWCAALPAAARGQPALVNTVTSTGFNATVLLSLDTGVLGLTTESGTTLPRDELPPALLHADAQ